MGFWKNLFCTVGELGSVGMFIAGAITIISGPVGLMTAGAAAVIGGVIDMAAIGAVAGLTNDEW